MFLLSSRHLHMLFCFFRSSTGAGRALGKGRQPLLANKDGQSKNGQGIVHFLLTSAILRERNTVPVVSENVLPQSRHRRLPRPDFAFSCETIESDPHHGHAIPESMKKVPSLWSKGNRRIGLSSNTPSSGDRLCRLSSAQIIACGIPDSPPTLW